MSIGLERLASDRFNFLSKNYSYDTGSNYNGKFLTGLIRYLHFRNHREDFYNQPSLFTYSECSYSLFGRRYSSLANIVNREINGGIELHIIYGTPINLLDNLFSPYDCNDIIELNQPSCPISQYLSSLPKQQAKVLVSKTQQIAIVFTSALKPSDIWFAKLYSSFSKLFPAMVGDIDDNLIKLFSLISKSNFNEANEVVENEIKDIDFEKEINKVKLHNFLSEYYVSKKNDMLNEVENVYREIKTYEERIHNSLDRIQDKNIYIKGLEVLCNKKDNDDVFTFFEQHKSLKIANIRKPDIYFVITETIEFYDVDEFKRCKDNWRYPSSFVKDIMRGLFELEKGHLYVLSKFSIKGMSDIKVYYDRNDCGYFDNVIDNPYMPHPHLGEYACLGANRQNINQYLQNGDWDLAIEQCIAATKNVAFGDATVMSYLREWINRNRDIKCVKVGDDLLTFNEFHKLIEGDLHNGEEN